MITEMWCDTFSKGYVLEKDPMAPEHRYYKVIRDKSELPQHIERWDGENAKEHYTSGYGMGIAYRKDEWDDPFQHALMFNYMCHDKGFNPTHLRYIVIPPDEFDEIVRKFALEEQDAKPGPIIQIPFPDPAP